MDFTFGRPPARRAATFSVALFVAVTYAHERPASPTDWSSGTRTSPVAGGTYAQGGGGDTCTLVYAMPPPSDAGSSFRISAGDTTERIGPGAMVLRVPRDASGAPADGRAELLHYAMDQRFVTRAMGVRVVTETRVCLLARETPTPTTDVESAPAAPTDRPECIARSNSTPIATGAFAWTGPGEARVRFDCYDPPPTRAGYRPRDAIGTADGCMQGYFSYGRVRCTSGCVFAGLPRNRWVDRSDRWSQHLLPLVLTAGLAELSMGDPDGRTARDFAHVPNTDRGWTGFALRGALDASSSSCRIR